MKISTFLLSILCLLLGIVVTALNSDTVQFNYYLNAIELPLSMLIIVILLMGVALGILISGGSLLKLTFENRGLKKKLNVLQSEISDMKVLDLSAIE